MHIARGIHGGNKIRSAFNSFLKLICRDAGNAQRKWLLRTLTRSAARFRLREARAFQRARIIRFQLTSQRTRKRFRSAPLSGLI